MSELADLIDLVLSESQTPAEASLPTPGLWSYRRPTPLPPSPIPGNSAPNELSPLPFPRQDFGLCATKNGDIYFCGGRNHDHPGLLYHYSTKNNTATVLQCGGDDPGPRYDHAITMVGSNVLALQGGAACKNGDKVDPSLFLLNLVSRKWLRIPTAGSAPGLRYCHSMVVIGTTIFMFGGDSLQYPKGSVNELWAPDIKTIHTQPRWELAIPSSDRIPSPRHCFLLVPYQNQLILFGGWCGSYGQSAETWSFNLNTKRWSQLQCTGDIPSPRSRIAGAVLDDVIYVIAGHSGGVINDVFAFRISGEVVRENSELRKRLVELERGKEETMKQNSRLQARLVELERDSKESKCQELITVILHSCSKADSLTSLQGMDAQDMADLLALALRTQELQSDTNRRRVLHLLRKLAKSAQVFLKHIELHSVQCSLTDPIHDKGSYGLIYEGVFEGQRVCVKAVRIDVGSGPAAKKILRAQAGELALLAHVSHPNVIPLYGAYLLAEHNPRICIVSPWMENGDLADYLTKFPNTPRIPLMSDVASGLQFLHDMGIVYANLKAASYSIDLSKNFAIFNL
ncbi:Tip elongation aberrant protein 1 [Leucoagaricus sp. SymC.cos]|nr:Tip elongation aberrant protein 1 [Leucoagaricus sp. SymC.cos]